MKRVKKGLLMVAIMIGMAGAFAFRSHPRLATADDTLRWYQTVSDNSSAPNTSGTAYLTAADAASALGCQTGNAYYCAAEYDLTTRQATGNFVKKSNP